MIDGREKAHVDRALVRQAVDDCARAAEIARDLLEEGDEVCAAFTVDTVVNHGRLAAALLRGETPESVAERCRESNPDVARIATKIVRTRELVRTREFTHAGARR